MCSSLKNAQHKKLKDPSHHAATQVHTMPIAINSPPPLAAHLSACFLLFYPDTIWCGRKTWHSPVHLLNLESPLFFWSVPFSTHTLSNSSSSTSSSKSPPLDALFRWRVCSHIDDLARCWIWVSIGTSWLTSTSILQFNML